MKVFCVDLCTISLALDFCFIYIPFQFIAYALLTIVCIYTFVLFSFHLHSIFSIQSLLYLIVEYYSAALIFFIKIKLKFAFLY